MSKIVWTGIESSGKSLQLSIQAEMVLRRNARWFKITGVERVMAFNTPMSELFISCVNKAGCRYLYFKNLDDILFLEESDIFIDEIIKFFPALGSTALSLEQMHFLTQGAKSGVNVYACSQDFSQVHKHFRLLTNEVYVVTKVIGSRRPMKSAPPVNYIWGLGFKRQVTPSSFKGDSATMESVGFPMPFMIWRVDCERFDTSFKVPLSTLPIKRVRKQVILCDEDGYTKTVYV